MVTRVSFDVIPAPIAHQMAGISYRQLDYWARRGWVPPSVDPGRGRSGRRLYSPDDVVRLAALAHFGRSGHDLGKVGPVMAVAELPSHGDWLLVLSDEGELETVPAPELRGWISRPGSHTVFDPLRLRRRLGLTRGAPRQEARPA